jgi:TonB family protein
VIGLALAIPIVFGLTVAGVWFWIRWQNQRAQAPAPEPTAVAAEATPTPAPPAATPAATAPSPEPTPEETPTPETSTTPPPATDEATLLVRSQPIGASVFVGSKKRGTTPLKLRLPAGAASVRVEKEGYKPWKNDARLRSGETRTLDARLEPLAAPTHAPTATPPPAKPALREGDLVPLSDEVTPPKKTKSVSPNVPAIARKKHMAGSVLIEFIVNVDGTVADVKVIESAGEVLDGAALEAVRQWRYQPATSHGVKVRVTQRARFTFQ